MSEFLLTLFITFVAISLVAFLINYCRRRLRKTPHGLTGMCHKSGGTICSTCQDKAKEDEPDS